MEEKLHFSITNARILYWKHRQKIAEDFHENVSCIWTKCIIMQDMSKEQTGE